MLSLSLVPIIFYDPTPLGVQSPSRSTKPRFLSSPESVVTIEIGAPLNLSYTAQGHPTPSFEWYKDDVLLPGEFQPFLYIAEGLPEDRGNYSCKAINSEGVTQSSQIQINITGIYYQLTNLFSNRKCTPHKQVFSSMWLC